MGRRRADLLSVSEVMTILIHEHQSPYRRFKVYSTAVGKKAKLIPFMGQEPQRSRTS